MSNPKHGSGSGKPKREHHIVLSGAISAHTPIEEQKEHRSERETDATTHIAERKADRGRENKKLWLEGIGLLAVLFYSGVTTWQGCMLRESITNNTKQFQIDQRPYVWPLEYTPTKQPPHIVAGEKMWINVSWVNYGKSPAVRAIGTGKIFISDKAMQQADNWFLSLGNGPLATQSDEEVIVPPVIPSDPEKPLGGYSTVMSDSPLKPEEVEHILHADEPYVAVLRFQYYDLAGNRYWSDVCMTRFGTGSFPFCAKHNEIH